MTGSTGEGAALAASGSLCQVVGYGTLCAASLAAGGAIAARWPPSATLRGYIQHIAAGLVFAAVGVEVLPDVIHRDLPLAAALGFASGVALMLTIRTVSERLGEGGRGTQGWTLIAAVSTDIFVDGALIGVSSVTDRGHGQQALLVTIALSAELLSLGLSLAARLGRSGASRTRSIVTTSIVSSSALAGAITGFLAGGALSGGWVEGTLAFAAAALLYLAAEELLKEAHEVPETLLSTALFFGAFLALLLIAIVAAAR